jgi:UDP-glucuronate 4-epimerase
MQPGDVPATYADIDALVEETGFRPQISLEEGIHRFALWYKCHYQRDSVPACG